MVASCSRDEIKDHEEDRTAAKVLGRNIWRIFLFVGLIASRPSLQ